MNIKEAKLQIKNAMKAYFMKDELGKYCIPVEQQRPVFLMGPPGVGKTAIMKQIAGELGVGLLSYSMTHHTRQSILGLPFIARKTYGGTEYAVSEYTMSEIIASVYEVMEKTGVKEGILFVDEINCVSETLAPVMLQFLQYKTFGNYTVPEGWIVVAAGNPPEYNNSVREFDLVTWDRLKRIDITPDYTVWKEYAYEHGVHGAILSYLNIKTDRFYRIRTGVEGKLFVTARGWDDLSRMIHLYERGCMEVDRKLAVQYIQDKEIANDFAVYYDLYNKYKSAYQIDEIVQGCPSETVKKRAHNAAFDERYSLIGLLIDYLGKQAKSALAQNSLLHKVMTALKKFKVELTSGLKTPTELLNGYISAEKSALKKGKIAVNLSEDEEKLGLAFIEFLEELKIGVGGLSAQDAFGAAKGKFDAQVAQYKKLSEGLGDEITHSLQFVEEVLGEQEVSILLLELSANKHTATVISNCGNSKFHELSKLLLVDERRKDIELGFEMLKLAEEE